MLSICLVFSIVAAIGWARNVYIDFGANNGDSVKQFVDSLGVSKESLTGDEKNLISLQGSYRNMKDWELYVFEALPYYTSALKKLETELLHNKSVKSFTLYSDTAIFVRDGTISFVIDPEMWHEGSTLMRDSVSATGKTVEVQCVDIVTLFKSIGQFSVEDKVFVKMDVEGAEYAIVRRMIQYGLLEYIDRIAVEWHHTNPYVFGEPEGSANATNAAAHFRQVAIHKKYLKQYKDLMSQLSRSEVEKFSKWD